jgi:hypothetical protein
MLEAVPNVSSGFQTIGGAVGVAVGVGVTVAVAVGVGVGSSGSRFTVIVEYAARSLR